MKKSLKILSGLLVFFSLCSVISFVSADTGVTYAGTLSQYATQEKNDVNTTLDTIYQRVYTKFQNSGLALMKTLNYQSLVCLGVMKQDDSLLNKMQIDRQELRLSFLKDFLAIESEIATLEEKNRIQGDTTISLFAYGTSYESEKARIAQKIATTKNLHLGFMRNFESTHTQKLQDFISTVLEYSKANTGVIGFLNDKFRKIQSIEDSFATLDGEVSKINTSLIGGGADFLASAQNVRSGFVSGLGVRVQTLIDSALRANKKLTGLEEVLMHEKEFALRNYGLDFDEKMNTIMSDRYNKKDYENIKAERIKFKNDFMSGDQLSCTKVYAAPIVFDLRINTLLNKIETIKSGLMLGVEMAQKPGSTQSLKTALLAGFTEFNKQNLNKKVVEFRKIIRQKVSEVAGAEKTTNVSTVTSNVNMEGITNRGPILFTRPFKKGETGTAVKNLQILLKNHGYYKGTINGIFTTMTIQGVYQFQLKNGLLIGYEKKPATRGWMGPATRAKLNELAVAQ